MCVLQIYCRYACFTLSSVWWYLTSTRIVRLSTISLVFLYRLIPFIRFPVGDMLCPSVISHFTQVPWSGPLPSSDLFNHVYDICLTFYLDVWFSVPIRDVNILSILSTPLLACSLPGWWVSMYLQQCMSVQEVRMTCIPVSSSEFQGHFPPLPSFFEIVLDFTFYQLSLAALIT